jgi:hypothetical protein
MGRPKIVIRIWLLLSLAALLITLVVARPMLSAWRCIERASAGEHAVSEVHSKHEDEGVVLRITSGSQTGEHCTVKVGRRYFAELEPGDPIAVITYADRPSDCELADTLEASEALLTAVGAALAIVYLLLLLLGFLVQRSFTQIPELSSRFDAIPDPVTCARCQKPMREGYLVPLSGLHWRSGGQPIGLPNIFGGLPGSVGWRGRPCLHAYRCEGCEIATFRYGKH